MQVTAMKQKAETIDAYIGKQHGAGGDEILVNFIRHGVQRAERCRQQALLP